MRHRRVTVHGWLQEDRSWSIASKPQGGDGSLAGARNPPTGRRVTGFGWAWGTESLGFTPQQGPPPCLNPFVLRRNLAVQFHPELDHTLLSAGLGKTGVAKLLKTGVDPLELLAATRAASPRSAARAQRLVDGFI